jgi:uncharacterized protein YndB with AHSA1/START domain
MTDHPKPDAIEHTGRVIRDEIRVEAPAEEVWRAWTDPAAITGWFVGGMRGRMTPGETVEWFWDEEAPGMRQRVLVADAPNRLVTEMELPQGVSILEVTVEQEDGHSVVRLVQSGFGEGPEWDDEFEGMLSGWMMALGVLKLFAEHYVGRDRREVLVLDDATFDRQGVLELQRTDRGIARWLARSGTVGRAVGEPVRLELEDGRTLTGTVLRTTGWETLWSWDEIDGVVEIKAFRAARWGSKVGVRISSWLDDAAELADLEGWLTKAVGRLAGALAEG